MARIQLSGLASGMDTDAVVNQLMTLERAPRARMELRQVSAQARQDAIKDVAAQLTKLKDAATALRSAATWGDVQTVESSESGKVAVRALSGAAPGGYQVSVTSLASADQRTYAFASQSSASQLTINGQTVDIPADAVLADAVAAINAKTETGVLAVDVGGRLVLSSRTTGAASSALATGAGLTEDTAARRAGADAAFTVDGVAKTSAGNVVSGVIPGLELTLKAPTTSATSITVGAPAPDQAQIKAKLKAFVETYNGVVDVLRTKTNEKVVPNATTSTDAKRGVLFGDTNLRGVLTSLRSVAGTLGDLGITTGGASATTSQDALAGKLTFDEAKFTERLAADPAGVQTALAGTAGAGGFARAIEAVVTPQTETGGVLDGRQTAIGGELKAIKDAVARFDDRLARREEALRARFAALEQALSRSQAQQQDFAARLGLNR